jgi:UDP-glucose 4-epimerase
MAARRALITGITGMVGSHLAEFLLERTDWDIVGMCRWRSPLDNLASIAWRINAGDRVSLLYGDLRDTMSIQNVVANAKPDYVFHLAAQSFPRTSFDAPLDTMDTNVQGTVRVLECARAANVRKFIYAASSSCYGLAAVPTREDHPIAPEHPYALSKYMGEMAVLHWHRVYRLPTNSIRIFNAYGPRVRTTGAYGAVFGVFFKQKLAGKPFTVIGDGLQQRDFLFVTDIAAAFLLAAESRFNGEIWNLGAGNPQSVNRLVELLDGPTVHIPKRPGEPDCTWADIGKIQRDLGWKPVVPFDQGVRRMMEDIELWRDAPLWDPQSIAVATKTWFDYLGREA